jgi:hypothetical protein
MINALLAKIMIGILYVGIILLFAWIWKKFKKKPVAGGTVGFFIGLIPIVMLAVLPTKAYIVFGEADYSTYWVYGAKSYTLHTGETVEITSSNLESTVINDSKKRIEIEEVVYGNGFYEPEITQIFKGEMVVFDKDISFFFDDEIPNQIEVEAGKYAIRLWMRN